MTGTVTGTPLPTETATGPRRRGACPGLAVPMPTGDGLLARLRPVAPITPAAMAGLAAGACAHGNGVIEVTSRGSLQVRGLTGATAPRFAAAVAELGITVADGTTVIAGCDGAAEALAPSLRRAIAAARLALSAKVCVVVDGGGALHLDSVAADVRLRAGGAGFHVGIATPSAGAEAWLGTVAAGDAPSAVVGVLAMIAASGAAARARDAVARAGVEAFRSALSLAPAPPPPPRAPAEIVGHHRFPDGTTALGIALAFGHARAEALAELAGHARRWGVAAVRPVAPGGLLLTGAPVARARDLTTAAADLGFVTDPVDPRRAIAACAGAPSCAAGLIHTRALAAALAPLIPPASRGVVVVHVSGCAKGCAHPRPARLTLTGHARGVAVVYGATAAGVPDHYAEPARLGAEVAALAPASAAPSSTAESPYG